MADTARGGMPRQAQFIGSTGTVAVTLDDKHIVWKSDEQRDEEATTVPLADVLAIQTIDDQNNEGTGFRIHYSTLADNHVRMPAKIEFRSREPELAKTWTDTLKRRYSNETSGRPQRLLVYVNPISGGGKARQIYDQNAAPVFELAGIATDIVVSTHRGHISEHVMGADLSTFDGIVTVGGDGTFTEVTSGLLLRHLRASGGKEDDPDMALRATDIPVGIIPAGTGQLNVLKLYNSQDPTTAALSIIQGTPYHIDAYTVHDDSRFVGIGNIMFSFGIFCHMLETAEGNRRWLGLYRYLWGLAKSIYYMNKYEGEVEVTRTEETSGQPGESRFHGEVFDVVATTYDAFIPRDYGGVLHVDILKSETSRREYIKYLSKYHRKLEEQNFPYVDEFRASKFRVKPRRGPENTNRSHVVPSHVTIDGDLYPVSGEWIHVTNVARVIRVFIARRPGGGDEGQLDFAFCK